METKTWAKSICRLCLKITFDNCLTINEEISAELFELLFCLTLHISDNAVMCKECENSLQNAISFKKSRKILPNLYSENDIRQYFNTNELSNTVCQFCIHFPIQPRYLPEVKQNMFLMEILGDLRAKLKITFIEDPIACEKCYKVIRDILQFTTTCSNAEEKINRYIEIEGTNSNGRVDLKDVRDFPYKSIKKYDTNVEDQTFCVGIVNNGKNEIKSETKNENSVTLTVDDLMGDSDSEECNEIVDENVCVKNEEVDIKTENEFDSLVDIKRRHASKVFICKLCSYSSKYRHCIARHLLRHKKKSEVDLFRCQKCTFATKYSSGLTRHMITHQDIDKVEIYQCSECNFQTKHKYGIRKHSIVHKSSEEITMFACPTCGREFKRNQALKKHILTHEKFLMPKFRCDVCSYESIWKDNLATHLLRHKDVSQVAMFKCDLCSYETKMKASLKTHLRRHSKKKKKKWYRCTSCCYKSKYEGPLKKHWKADHE